MTRRRGSRLLEAGLLVGALLSIFGIASLVPLPWALPVLAVLIAVELTFYRHLGAERGEGPETY